MVDEIPREEYIVEIIHPSDDYATARIRKK